ncbi:MAG: hypothetical protein ABRQ37_03185 [Candidatus Eremiobacterota bacterium]
MRNLILILCLIIVIFPGCLKSGPSVKDLQGQIVKMEKENQELKSHMEDVEKGNRQLKISLEDTKKENKHLKVQTEKIKKENNQLKIQVNKVKKERDNAVRELEKISGKVLDTQDLNSENIPSNTDEFIDDVNKIKDDVLKGAGY